MNCRLFPLTVLASALLAANSHAAGFGEIILHSRVGEALRAEVPLIGDRDGLETACFSLTNKTEADLPVVVGARIKLVREGNAPRLVITGHRPVADPIFVVALRANCGVELSRDYVLMPQPPLDLAISGSQLPVARAEAPVPPRRPVPGRTWSANEGDSLASLAESMAPDNPAKQRRLLAALQSANPDIAPAQPLAEGSAVRIPAPRKPVPPPRPDNRRPGPPALPPAGQGPLGATGELPPPSPTPATTGDRVVLGAPPADIRPDERAGPPRGSMPEVEQRILKMETTIGLLNDQVTKLNEAITLATESLVLQQKLQAAQASQAASSTVAAPVAQPPATPPRHESSNSWLQLLLSALVGGGIASFTAHLLSKRRQEQTLAELSDGFTAAPTAPEAQPSTPPPSVPAPRPPAPRATPPRQPAIVPPPAPPEAAPTAVDLDLGEPAPGDVSVDEGDSALHLAEIMLSYGRVKGAVDVLATHIEKNAPDRIEPWLTLLNLYRRGNLREEFEVLMQRMRQRFNFQIPGWEQSQTPISGLLSLEDYGHITHSLVDKWGTQPCMDYLASLIHDNRHGQRSGFPLEVIEEIVLLMLILEEVYGCKRHG